MRTIGPLAMGRSVTRWGGVGFYWNYTNKCRALQFGPITFYWKPQKS